MGAFVDRRRTCFIAPVASVVVVAIVAGVTAGVLSQSSGGEANAAGLSSDLSQSPIVPGVDAGGEADATGAAPLQNGTASFQVSIQPGDSDPSSNQTKLSAPAELSPPAAATPDGPTGGLPKVPVFVDAPSSDNGSVHFSQKAVGVGTTVMELQSPSPPPPAQPQQAQVQQVVGSWTDNPREDRFPAQAKRGICWMFRDKELGDKPMRPFDRLSWTYNWKLEPEASNVAYYAEQGIEFVPMLWGKWGIEDIVSKVPQGSKTLLVFNEPNHKAQAALFPKEAAALWPAIEKAARQRGLRLSSPAVSPCGGNDEIEDKYADPFVWLDEFLDLCNGCTFDVVATHYYGCNLEWVQGYLNKFKSKYGLPVWLTEFACPMVGNDDRLPNKFLKEFMEWADTQPWLERYSWFSLDVGEYIWLGQGNRLMDMSNLELTELGKKYNTYVADGVETFSVPDGDLAAGLDWSHVCGLCAKAAANGTKEEQAYCAQDCGFLRAGQAVYMGPREREL